MTTSIKGKGATWEEKPHQKRKWGSVRIRRVAVNSVL